MSWQKWCRLWETFWRWHGYAVRDGVRPGQSAHAINEWRAS